ncbi:hypothetical protein CONLIGDRAFT_283866 [Coniochaeta ligniaria NRRL 30616]|uniref:Uncharacterized protein n=1 Tax=Coniochaeta ligniaria NRRL 30616 TaxID=1408157 RepID=A0A1J7JBA3_9PEZI|nr:hypothetical protein CONLIGDRAFT_283866 [Coniochaeta ligniaria NRRL 30616]
MTSVSGCRGTGATPTNFLGLPAPASSGNSSRTIDSCLSSGMSSCRGTRIDQLYKTRLATVTG